MSAVVADSTSDVGAGASTIADSTRKIVTQYQAATMLLIKCFIVIRGNKRIRRELGQLRGLISQLIVEEPNDRRMLLYSAKRLGESSKGWENMHEEWVSMTKPRLPRYIPLMDLFGTTIANQLEEHAEVTDDLAETLALAASEPFAELVKQELNTERAE